MSLLQMQNVSYEYSENHKKVLSGVDMDFEAGKFYAIVGNSGAGKSTLLSLLAGLDEPDSGKIIVKGKDIKETGYGNHRRYNISLVFQNYNLIDYMTPMENITLVDRQASSEVLVSLGLAEEDIKRNVMKLSGGQQQRVAIGRALVSKAPVILADEPTGNLDEKTAADIVDILKKAAHEDGKCVIVVNHSKDLANAADRVLNLKNRKLI